jgi:hypothetical protein
VKDSSDRKCTGERAREKMASRWRLTEVEAVMEVATRVEV